MTNKDIYVVSYGKFARTFTQEASILKPKLYIRWNMFRILIHHLLILIDLLGSLNQVWWQMWWLWFALFNSSNMCSKRPRICVNISQLIIYIIPFSAYGDFKDRGRLRTNKIGTQGCNLETNLELSFLLFEDLLSDMLWSTTRALTTL